MKMTKRLERKLQALADKMGIETNFDWDLGWFDFSKNCVKLGAVRFYGDAMTTKHNREIYVATAYTKICYYENGKWSNNMVQQPLLIWEPTIYSIPKIDESSTHETLTFNDENEATEEIILGFLEACFTHCMKAKFYEVEEKRITNLMKDF